MPTTRRKPTTDEKAARLERAEWLQAHGVTIDIPEDWREDCCPFEILLEGCTLLDRAGAPPAYCIPVHMRTKRSGLTFPELELETGWDTPTLPDSFEEEEPVRGSRKCCPLVQFAGHNYPKDEVLNLRMGQNFPASRVIAGYILAEGLHRLPAEFPDSGILPFDLILRDWFSGELIHRVQAEVEVCRIRAPKGSVPPVEESAPRSPKTLTREERQCLERQRMAHAREDAFRLRYERASDALEKKRAKRQLLEDMRALENGQRLSGWDALYDYADAGLSDTPQSSQQKPSRGTGGVEPASVDLGGGEAFVSESER